MQLHSQIAVSLPRYRCESILSLTSIFTVHTQLFQVLPRLDYQQGKVGSCSGTSDPLASLSSPWVPKQANPRSLLHVGMQSVPFFVPV